MADHLARQGSSHSLRRSQPALGISAAVAREWSGEGHVGTVRSIGSLLMDKGGLRAFSCCLHMTHSVVLV
jgi:hypothetical protein